MFLTICILQTLKVLPGSLPEGGVTPKGVLQRRPHAGGVPEAATAAAGPAAAIRYRFRPNHTDAAAFNLLFFSDFSIDAKCPFLEVAVFL